jgi:hypothetical protein
MPPGSGSLHKVTGSAAKRAVTCDDLGVVGLSIILVLGSAAPRGRKDSRARAFVVLTGRANVPPGQVGDLVVFHGSSTVDGTVDVHDRSMRH